jgi:putative ABC transport system permease protein
LAVNLANLQLARSVAQSGEQALRSALGASRARMMGEAFLENLLLALAGMLVALPLAWAGVRLLVAIAPANLPDWAMRA